ncbi:hypothetical protein CNR22_12660 [Sphingobacteriaceae bacterium]|nr:hypothetical protein CNR22_12660 [Sphingobacteriaceae bacterium]
MSSSPSSAIKIMLADDHEKFRRSMIEELSQQSDRFNFIGEASHGLELLSLMEKNIPDVVLLDLEMPVLDGYKTMGLIKERFPTVRTIILSSHYNEFYIARLIISGASGYLSKLASIEDILKTLRRVYEDGFYISEKISRIIFMTLLDSKKLAYSASEKILKDREVEVLREICNGKTYKEAAGKLNLSTDTIKFYIKNIYKKTQTNSIAALVKYAVKTGITNVY